MINLNRLGQLICQQAKDKGWGYTKKALIVSEKMILVSTEITELQEARTAKILKPKDTVQSEYSDILMRVLHLGTAWGVDFNQSLKYLSRLKSKPNNFNLLDLLYLHNLVSKAYDYYRHKKVGLFKRYLYILAHETLLLSQTEEMDIETAALNKMSINSTRTWSQSVLNGNYKNN